MKIDQAFLDSVGEKHNKDYPKAYWKNGGTMKNREEQIRQICTYHSDGGTSGYNLSEEQFQKLFNLLASQEKTIRQEMASEILAWIAKNATKSARAGILGYDFVHRLEESLKSKYLSEQKQESTLNYLDLPKTTKEHSCDCHCHDNCPGSNGDSHVLCACFPIDCIHCQKQEKGSIIH